MRACDCVGAVLGVFLWVPVIVLMLPESCHATSVRVLEEKKSRPSGWFVVQAKLPHAL